MKYLASLTTVFFTIITIFNNSYANPNSWSYEWPNTDFSQHSVEFSEIISGGPPKDGIPPIDNPTFIKISKITNINNSAPLITININNESRAYPLSILIWHEIVNDKVAGIPITITFCPLCNSAIVFDRRIDNKILDFGTTGKLRNSDLIMWDRQTESWWQQFMGKAIVGEMTGKTLTIIPARIESFASFKKRTNNDAMILVANIPNSRNYGKNPYVGYDSGQPFLYNGETPKDIKPLERVISLASRDQAWSISLLRKKQRIITKDGVVIKWLAGQNSALDTKYIKDGKDVGNITDSKNGKDVIYFIDFAFAFHAFKPNMPIYTINNMIK